MESDDQMMMHKHMQDEADVVANGKEKLMIIFSLLRLRARINAPPRWGGSRLEKKKNNKDRNRCRVL
jgi:hypothetical protein